jgi:hypothetical protein
VASVICLHQGSRAWIELQAVEALAKVTVNVMGLPAAGADVEVAVDDGLAEADGAGADVAVEDEGAGAVAGAGAEQLLKINPATSMTNSRINKYLFTSEPPGIDI